MIVAVGNDAQFMRFCEAIGHGELAGNPDYANNTARTRNRTALIDTLIPILMRISKSELLEKLQIAGVPSGPIYDLEEVFASEQVEAREMKISMDHPLAASGKVDLIGNPVKFSATPVTYRIAPPACGADSDEILQDWLGDTASPASDVK